MAMGIVPRLVYLAEEHRIPLPKDIARLVPYGDFVRTVGEKGLVPAQVDFDIDPVTANKYYDNGRVPPGGEKPSRGDAEEFRYWVGQCAIDSLETKRPEMQFSEYLNMVAAIRDYVIFGGDELVITDDIPLGGEDDVKEIPKFRSGFTPFDDVTGGFYQGIVTVMGSTGHGKTSLMLAMLESMKKSGIATSSIFYEVEIARDMMLWKLKPARARTRFTDDDRLLTGNWTTRQILKDVMENPDPNRVVFIDGPDAMTASVGDKKRFAIEAIYRDLKRIADVSKIVVVSSQTRRGDPEIQLESLAEAWAKAHYSDIVIGITRLGPKGLGVHRLKADCLKNRFGSVGSQLSFDFNYLDLTWVAKSANDDWRFDWMAGTNGKKKIAGSLTDDRKTEYADW